MRPDRHVQHGVCQLVIVRVPGTSGALFQQLRNTLREHAPHTEAHALDDMTWHTGAEPPATINVDTTTRMFVPARRDWSPAKGPVADERAQEPLSGNDPVCMRVARNDHACNPAPAMKQASGST